MKKTFHVFLLMLLLCIATAVFAQETESKDTPYLFFIPAGYNFTRLEDQIIHYPRAGVGFMIGEDNIPFNEVNQRFMGIAQYQTYIFNKPLAEDFPELFHEAGAFFDGRINRHQLLFFFKSISDKPVAGGLNTIQLEAGWGYELIRRPQASLILGAVIIAGDFSDMLPSGINTPVLPMPLIRFGVDTQWFTSSFEFISGPYIDFAVAPKERFHFTVGAHMDQFRSIDDLVYELTLWYRPFGSSNPLGDMARIGAGVKSDLLEFDLARYINQVKTLGLVQRSIFAAIDITFLSIQGGWVFNSRYLTGNERTGSPGRRFFISIQGMIPIKQRGML